MKRNSNPISEANQDIIIIGFIFTGDNINITDIVHQTIVFQFPPNLLATFALSSLNNLFKLFLLSGH